MVMGMSRYGRKHSSSTAVNGKPTPEYYSWISMKTRCNNINASNYYGYGGRGIRVCNRWLNSFENFLADMGPRPIGTTLHRKRGLGNYCKSNCVWANWSRQANNRRKYNAATGHHNSLKDSCKNGHELTGSNVGLRREGGRYCKICNYSNKRRHRSYARTEPLYA